MKHKRLYAVLIVLAALDLLTTFWAFSQGITEKNPFYLSLPLMAESMIVIHGIGLLAIWQFAYWTEALKEKGGGAVIVAACSVWFTVVIGNICYQMGAML